jgi:adenylate kinase
MKDCPEVVEPDVLAVVLNELEQAVLLEREPDEVVDRVPEDRRQDEDDGQNEEVRNRPAGDAAAG